MKKIKQNKSRLPKSVVNEEDQVITLETCGYTQLYRCTNCSNLQVYEEECVMCHISTKMFKLEKVSESLDKDTVGVTGFKPNYDSRK